jgi:hypothetical protein
MMRRFNFLYRGVLMTFAAIVICLMLAGSVQSEECEATGDFDGSGLLDIGDLTSLIGFLYMGADAPDPLFEVDLTGDCIIDTLDIIDCSKDY